MVRMYKLYYVMHALLHLVTNYKAVVRTDKLLNYYVMFYPFIFVQLYCSEVWGVYLDPGDSSIVEKFHMKFIKEILGVHCKASNVACRTELVRLPLWAKIAFSCIKFWEHLLTSENTLVFKFFSSYLKL
jgi:IS1 family transposase